MDSLSILLRDFTNPYSRDFRLLQQYFLNEIGKALNSTHIKDDYPLCYILTVVFSDGTMESINLYYCYDANDIWKRITKTLKEKYKPQEDVPAPAINPFSVPRKLNLSL